MTNNSARFSQGSKSVKAVIDNRAGGYGYPGVEYHPSTLTDLLPYEIFIYDVWPAVNARANELGLAMVFTGVRHCRH